MITMPFSVMVELKPHQKEALKWMKEIESDDSKKGGILADAMGLGKTVTLYSLIIDSFNKSLESNEMEDFVGNQTLIVAPLSLIEQLKNEFSSKTTIPDPCILLFHGVTKNIESIADYLVVITTYGKMITEWDVFRKTGKSVIYDTKFHRIALDEAHTIKSKNTISNVRLSKISSKKKWCITGTPFNNRKDDVISLCRFIGQAPYCDELWWKENEKNQKEISKWRESFVMMRDKSVLNLAPPICNTIALQFSNEERVCYEYVKKQAVDFYETLESNGGKKTTPILFSLISKMRKICNHPYLLMGRLATRHLSEESVGKTQFAAKESCVSCHGRCVYNLLCGHNICKNCLSDYSIPINKLQDKVTPKSENSKSKKRERLEYENSQETFKNDFALIRPESIQNEEEEENEEYQDDQNEDKNCVQNVCNLCDMILRGWTRGNIRKRKLFADKNHKIKESTKTDKVVSLIQNAWKSDPNDKFIIFSQWASSMDLIESALATQNISVLRLDGDVKNHKHRQEIIKKFMQTPQTKILISSIICGGVGLNLTVANRVILFEPNWNPFLEKQAIDRCHRLGQTKTVHVYRIIIKDSIEESVLEVQNNKLNDFQVLLNASKDHTRHFENGKLSKKQKSLDADENSSETQEEEEEENLETSVTEVDIKRIFQKIQTKKRSFSIASRNIHEEKKHLVKMEQKTAETEELVKMLNPVLVQPKAKRRKQFGFIIESNVSKVGSNS